jgi:hypothetical protein
VSLRRDENLFLNDKNGLLENKCRVRMIGITWQNDSRMKRR